MIESTVTQDILFLYIKKKNNTSCKSRKFLKSYGLLIKKSKKANNKLIVSENKFIVNQGSKSS